MPESLDPILFDRYLAGECTPDEDARVRTWIAEDPERRDVDAVRFRADATATNGAWEKMSSRLGVEREPRLDLRDVGAKANDTRRKDRTFFKTLHRITPSAWRAPLVVAGLGLAAAMFLYRQPLLRNRAEPMQRYTTTLGQRAIVRLPDGSRVTLAPGTTLLVDPTFGRSRRTLTLEGEAYFEVPTAKGVPFTVRTGNVETRVLGTAFTVKRYPTDASVQVVVASGRVSSRGRGASGVITAGQIAYLTDSTITTREGNVDAYTAWATGRLAFNNTPVTEMLRAVGLWYGIDFQLRDSALAAQPVTVTFDQISNDEALRIIASLLDVTMTTEHGVRTAGTPQTITLTPRRTSRAGPRRGTRHTFLPLMEFGK